MIALLTGRLAFKASTHLTLDVQGVGYEVFIPLSTYYALPDLNETTSLCISTHLREDALQLYGFMSAQEKEMFVLLNGVSGIGPKLALSALSALSVPDLVSAIQAGDVEKLATVPGIGNKSAGRIVLDLKDKVGRLHPGGQVGAVAISDGSSPVFGDALSALVNLGYRAGDAKEALARLKKTAPPKPSLKELIRDALKELSKG
jgi:Holliday junction DNA helicase RuvA